jgi:transforming growth factor-beta-induced protein
MRKFFITMLMVTALLLMSLPTLAQQPNVVEAAVANEDFSTLVAAVQAANLAGTLSGPGPFTVFAPTNGAFQTLLNDLGLTAEELLANTNLLNTVLLYHVVPGEVTASDILNSSTPFSTATAGGEAVRIDVVNGKVELNDGQAIVIQPDLQVSNGVIHVIDNVILPPSITGASVAAAASNAGTTGGPTVVDVAASVDDFSTLVAAVQAAGLVDTLNGPGPFTIFAPTNGAFQTLLGELGVTADELLTDTDLLTQVLTYHVVPGRVTSTDIVSGSTPFDATTVNGAAINVNVVDGKVNLNDGEAIVIIPDIEASNGIIHVIDNVLVPGN